MGTIRRDVRADELTKGNVYFTGSNWCEVIDTRVGDDIDEIVITRRTVGSKLEFDTGYKCGRRFSVRIAK